MEKMIHIKREENGTYSLTVKDKETNEVIYFQDGIASANLAKEAATPYMPEGEEIYPTK